MDVVLVGTFENIEATIRHKCLEMLIADDFMKFERLVYQIFGSDLDADTRSFLDVLVGGILDKSKHIFNPDVLHFHAYFATDQILEVADRDEFGIEFDVVWAWVAADVEEDAHLGAIIMIIIKHFRDINQGPNAFFLCARVWRGLMLLQTLNSI